MTEGMGWNVMWVAGFLSMVVQLVLWGAVGLVGYFRAAARARFVFLGAGVAGVLMTVTLPMMQAMLSFVVYDQIGYDKIGWAQAGMATVGSVASLVPWGLLVLGIWRSKAD